MKSQPSNSNKTRARKTAGEPRRLRIVWTPEQDALLGKLADWEVAQRLRRKLSTVRARRERLHIPPAFLTAKEYPRFVGQRVAHLDPWTGEQDELLGMDSDAEVASILDRKAARVTNRRYKLDVPPCYPSPPHPRRWTEKEEQLLGTASDEAIARKIKRTVLAVRHRRMVKRIRLRPP